MTSVIWGVIRLIFKSKNISIILKECHNFLRTVYSNFRSSWKQMMCILLLYKQGHFTILFNMKHQGYGWCAGRTHLILCLCIHFMLKIWLHIPFLSYSNELTDVVSATYLELGQVNSAVLKDGKWDSKILIWSKSIYFCREFWGSENNHSFFQLCNSPFRNHQVVVLL